MDVSIPTAQQVDIEYRPATVADRFIAILVDSLILTAYNILAYSLLSAFSSWGLTVAIQFVGSLYYLVSEVVMDGQTPGKRLGRIKVMKLDGSQPQFGAYVMRWLFRLVETPLFFVSILVIVINGRGQRVGDLAAGTTVVRLNKRTEWVDKLLAVLNRPYTITFPQVSLLNRRDAETAREIVERYRHYREDRSFNRQLLEDAAERLRNHLGITDTDMSTLEFMDTLIRDYSYHTRGM